MHGHGEYKMPGGKLVVADIGIVDGCLAQVAVSGDFFLEPETALGAINAALTGLAVASEAAVLAAAVQAGLPAGALLYGISPEAVAEAVRRAVEGAGA